MLFILVIFISNCQISCKKYLDKKPIQNLAIPTRLEDFKALLDNNDVLNAGSPGYLEYVADNFYLSASSWGAATIEARSSYIWAPDAIVHRDNWNSPYEKVYLANFILDYLPKINVSESERNVYNSFNGEALFFRAFAFYQIAQLFCKPFSQSADTDLGIVLRLSSAIEASSVRSTVKQTYDQVIADLKKAVELLPNTSLFSTHPNKAAALGMLARVYLSMSDYVNAGKYADLCLELNNTLLDYNSFLTGSPALPEFKNNPEIIYANRQGNAPYALLGSSHLGLIDTSLYKSYVSNDLRKTLFFGATGTGSYYWQGAYFCAPGQTFFISDGLATDEIYLIRAESKARSGDKDAAMADLNTLLRKRWKSGTYTDLTATDPSEALNKILAERRKELLFRGLRWTDIRRFNLEGANITLRRILNGITYTLPPIDLRWALLIPNDEIGLSGIPQNQR